MTQVVDFRLLISKLIELTDQDKCEWKETSEVERYKYYNYGNTIIVSHSNTLAGEACGFEVFDFQDEVVVSKSALLNNADYPIILNLYNAVKNYRERYVNKQMTELYNHLDKM